jgi:hypothetical protein
MTNQTNQEAVSIEVTEVLSASFSRTVPARADAQFEPISPYKVNKRMEGNLPWLQEVHWDWRNGIRGPRTLKKRVEVEKRTCPECGTIGRYDGKNDVICDDPECGVVISGRPYLSPEDHFNHRCGGGVTGTATVDPTIITVEDEPDVQ